MARLLYLPALNPENGKFFVGTKSIFNKVPKINYTEEDIINNHGHAPGLVDKLTKALRYLPQLGINNILQGDFMFDDEMLDVAEIDGEPHYRFKPNTIVYAVPVNSDLGREVGQSKFGIVFHTTYDSLDSGASFGADVSGLNRVPGIWFDDAYFTDDTGTVTLTENEERKVISLVEEADMVNKQINYDPLVAPLPGEEKLKNPKSTMYLLNIYINREIAINQFLENPESSFEGFINWYTKRSEAAINKLTTSKGQERKRGQQQQTLQFFNSNRDDILNLFRVSRLLFEAKNIFIEKYNNAVYNTKHFIDDGSGDLVATNPEGYVAVDHEGNGVKFVDRLEFSRANFMVDKSAKFTQESIKRLSEVKLNNFTIQISKDRQTTKTLGEWLDEINEAKHKYTKLPGVVYEDILNGGAIVDIVEEANALPTIYNTVLTYINTLNEEEEFEIVGHEESNLPTTEFGPTTWALVPGAFKPPHRGHLEMVERYTGMANKVRVLISNPLINQRTLSDGTKITSGDAEKIWGNMVSHLGEQVEVEISGDASPITATYNFIGKDGPLNVGDTVLLGVCAKGDDAARYEKALEYLKDGVNGEVACVPAAKHSDRYLSLLYKLKEEGSSLYDNMPSVKNPDPDIDPEEIHASDMRYLLVEAKKSEEAVELVGDFVPAGQIGAVFSTFGITPIGQEMEEPMEENAMAVGNVGGYAGSFPLGSTVG